ncbi:glutamine synthetase [Candidatus Tisiphia endosymbiont of Nemotelus uliginosus]|uniref:glutamine synthetase n=1 Tax=Candidatus Tisiphia endosymbiont of Nemotelus uliginosus TaxID=3077926 RepID=UPI0035C91924
MTPPQGFIDKLSDHLRQYNALEKLINELQINYGLIACIGVEIEFYLSDNIDINQFEFIFGQKITQEKGKNQFEVNLPPSTNVIDYIQEINTTQRQIAMIAQQLQGNVNFRSKPFRNDYGNSMHFHLNFLNNNTTNINSNFLTKLAHSICHYMLDTFLVFMPYEEDYLRLDKNFMAPINVSFGNNNRTVALRIPDAYPQRLEHRIANPLTNIYLAIFTILKSIFLGLQIPEQIKIVPKIYGNAFDEQYNLLPLPKSLAEALKLFKLEFFVPDWQYKLMLFDNGQSKPVTLESLLEILKKL